MNKNKLKKGTREREWSIKKFPLVCNYIQTRRVGNPNGKPWLCHICKSWRKQGKRSFYLDFMPIFWGINPKGLVLVRSLMLTCFHHRGRGKNLVEKRKEIVEEVSNLQPWMQCSLPINSKASPSPYKPCSSGLVL